MVERGAQELEGQIRALFLALQEKIGRQIDARERIVAFIPEYEGYVMNRLKRGSDGKVPYERSRGKTLTVLGVEFGEKVLFWKRKGPRMAKIEPRWYPGIVVGLSVGVGS